MAIPPPPERKSDMFIVNAETPKEAIDKCGGISDDGYHECTATILFSRKGEPFEWEVECWPAKHLQVRSCGKVYHDLR